MLAPSFCFLFFYATTLCSLIFSKTQYELSTMGLLHHDDKPSQPVVVDGAGNAQVCQGSLINLKTNLLSTLRQAIGGEGGARSKMDEVKAREEQIKLDEKRSVSSVS